MITLLIRSSSLFFVLLVFSSITSLYAQVNCDHFEAKIIPREGTFRYCPDAAGHLHFSGEAGYVSGSQGNGSYRYEWNFSGRVYTGKEVSHFFGAPGAYPVTLTVRDLSSGCVASVSELVKVGTVPTFDDTSGLADEVCAGQQFTLYGEASPTMWTAFPTSIDRTDPIPDGTGTVYSSSLVFDVFEPWMEVMSADDIGRICIRVEHVAQAQLRVELVSPNGTTLLLKAFGGPDANLGEPVVWDDNIPGVGYDYCFTPTPQFGRMDATTPHFHEYADVAGNYYFNAAVMPSGDYTPAESLNKLAGSRLNGTWTLRIEDNTPGETGHVKGWSLFFDEALYPDSLIFTPEIVDERWYHNGNLLGGNPGNVTVEQTGLQQFVFEVQDDFGCTYDTSFSIEVLPRPRAEIVSELEIPICEGDSTLLTVLPIDNDGYHWLYQWQMAGTDLPGRTYDTLMVKQPAVYSVLINDSLTGCFNIIDKEVIEQNCDLTIPNVFTPNGDGINDEFEILNLEHYPNAQMLIYNRWGVKVFEHSDYYNNWWDGRGAPDGVYFYILKYTRMGETRWAEGAVTIIR